MQIQSNFFLKNKALLKKFGEKNFFFPEAYLNVPLIYPP